MEAREVNDLVNSLSPLKRENLLETIRLKGQVSNLLAKPIHDSYLMGYVTDKLSGKEPRSLKHYTISQNHKNGKVKVIKEAS